MFVNNFKIAYRNLLNNKAFSFINISGLAIGMACTILLLLWVNHELSYDKFHKKEKQLFKIVNWQTYSGTEHAWESIPGQLVENLKEKYPEIVGATNYNSWQENHLLSTGEFKYYEKCNFVDPDFFTMFSFNLIKGNKNEVFKDPYSIVVTKKVAEKFFGKEDPIGKIIRFDDKYDVKISGIIEQAPSNSEFMFNVLFSYELHKKDNKYWQNWGSHSDAGFIEVTPNTNIETLNKKLSNFYVDHVDKESTERVTLFPLSKIHLYDLDGSELGIKTVRMFALIAIFILLIACFNFMNLSTARAAKRAKEIGVKKAIGSSRKRLIAQFLMESTLTAFIAVNFAILIARLFLPEFDHIMRIQLIFDYTDMKFIGIILTVILFTGLFAGIYPALFLTRYKAVDVMKGSVTSGKRGSFFRKILVVLQFTLTTILLISTIVITIQAHFLSHTSTGIDKKNIAFINLQGDANKHLMQIKEELKNDPSIEASTALSNLPISIHYNGGGFMWNNDESSKDVLVSMIHTDPDFIDVFKPKLIEGKFFNKNHFHNDSIGLIINETLAKMISTKSSVIGKTIKRSGYEAPIIGVVKDFNFKSLHQKIEPLVFLPIKHYNFLAVKYTQNTRKRAIEHIEKVVNRYNPNFPTVINFVSDRYVRNYYKEQKTVKILTYFTVLAILISCLGLFGMASFMAEEKTKEIGVRKVLGAQVESLMSLFTKEFSKWVIISNIIAWPIAWFAMDNYLSRSAYRIDMPWWVFIAVAFLLLTISSITVAYQSWKSATRNPVESLQYE